MSALLAGKETLAAVRLNLEEMILDPCSWSTHARAHTAATVADTVARCGRAVYPLDRDEFHVYGSRILELKIAVRLLQTGITEEEELCSNVNSNQK